MQDKDKHDKANSCHNHRLLQQQRRGEGEQRCGLVGRGRVHVRVRWVARMRAVNCTRAAGPSLAETQRAPKPPQQVHRGGTRTHRRELEDRGGVCVKVARARLAAPCRCMGTDEGRRRQQAFSAGPTAKRQRAGGSGRWQQAVPSPAYGGPCAARAARHSALPLLPQGARGPQLAPELRRRDTAPSERLAKGPAILCACAVTGSAPRCKRQGKTAVAGGRWHDQRRWVVLEV